MRRGSVRHVLSMLKIGVIGFGGGSALIPVFSDELVSRRRVLDQETFTRHTIVSSVTPGALPVKLGALVGLELSGAGLAMAMAVVVALPGTVATVGLLATVATGGEAVIPYVEAASVGVTVFIVALLVHYVTSVVAAAPQRWVAVLVIVAVAVLSGAPRLVALAGDVVGRAWELNVATLSTVAVIGLALMLVLARAVARRFLGGGRSVARAAGGAAPEARVVSWLPAAVLFAGAVAATIVVAVAVRGGSAGTFLGLVGLSSVTSFGGGEAYVAVADGFFVSGGYLSRPDFYTLVVPIANAMPGPILVKIAASVGFLAVGGGAIGWLAAGAATAVAIGSCTTVAVMVMGAYRRAQSSPVVADIGRYILPVICGLLVVTSASMLGVSGEVAERAGLPAGGVIWASAAGIAFVCWLRHRRIVHDVLLLLAAAACSSLVFLVS